MKSITQYILENDLTKEIVFVVKDSDGNFLNVFTNKKDAENERDKWNTESKSNKAIITEEPKSEYMDIKK